MDHAKDQDSVVLVTAEPRTLRGAYDILRLEAGRILSCTNLKAAGCVLRAVGRGIAVIDYNLPGVDLFLHAVKRSHPDVKCIVLAESASVKAAVRATRDLKARVVAKPLDATVLSGVVRACRKGLKGRRKLTRSRTAGDRGRGTAGPV